MDDRRVLAYARDALETLRRAVVANSDGEHNGIPTREARAVLADDEELSKAMIDDVLEVLYNRGEIYYVDEEVRITEMELSDADVRSDSE